MKLLPEFKKNEYPIALFEIMEGNKKDVNLNLAKYMQIAKIKIYPEEFEKTPKRSIKRFLYTSTEL